MLRGMMVRGLCVAVGLLVFTAGCLSLGGKTTHVHESVENSGRIAALEARVAELESALAKTGVPVTASAPSEGNAFAR
jgi:hypothetical protein